jgi:disulfide bond formation protein DsbB
MAFKSHLYGMIDYLNKQKNLSLAFILVSFLSLILALSAEYFLDIRPCSLCLYQRHVFGLLLGLGFIGLSVDFKLLRTLFAVVILGGLSLSVYHMGVEEKWWKGPKSCTVATQQSVGGSMTLEERIKNFQEQTDKQSIVRCDEVNWRIFGISATVWMIPFYLILLSLIMFTGGLCGKRFLYKRLS